MKLQILLETAIIQCACLLALAQPSPAAPGQTATPASQQGKATPGSGVPSDRGERKFRENCSRCHNAPEELPARITGTVVQHMRVRASLSAADERAILHYLAP